MVNSLLSGITESLRKLQIVQHLSRQKMLILTLCSMIKSRSVKLNEMAYHLNDQVKTASNETRLQDFFREVEFDYTCLSAFLFHFLMQGKGQKIRLCLDRTEWDFGQQQTNILLLSATKGDHTIPLFWELLDNNSGNSNTQDRIKILRMCLKLIDKKLIGLFIADREFIGHKWLKWLKDNKIPFCVRVPKSHLITKENGKILQAEQIWKTQKSPCVFQNCMVDNIWVSAKITTDAKGEMLFVIGNVNAHFLDQYYKKRWTIETIFQSFKSRGFDLEATHLKHNERIKKLIGIVAIAYAFCISLGIFVHEKVKKIKNKNHKRKANSFFRYGLDFIREGFKTANKYTENWSKIFSEFIQTFAANFSFSST